MSKIKKDYKFEDFVDDMETAIKDLKEEILELIEEEDEFIEIRLRNENNVVYILKCMEKVENLLVVEMDRAKHAYVPIEKLEGEHSFDKNLIKPLKICNTEANIRISDEESAEDSW
ncbi:MAG: hypothetical protein OIF32_01665 [Campylobacterales bacterium]|nr:hypothetical protein [Campylobacterales bacterium]